MKVCLFCGEPKPSGAREQINPWRFSGSASRYTSFARLHRRSHWMMCSKSMTVAENWRPLGPTSRNSPSALLT